MEQLTLEQRARDFAEMLYPGKGAYYICIKDGYVAGAEWQKEQTKELIALSRQLLSAYIIRHSDEKQLLVGYTNEEAFAKFNQLLEQLTPSE